MNIVENFVNLTFKCLSKVTTKKSWIFNHHGLITQGSTQIRVPLITELPRITTINTEIPRNNSVFSRKTNIVEVPQPLYSL